MAYYDEQGFQVYRAPVAEYLCRQWNARNSSARQVTEFEFLYCMLDKAAAKNSLNSRIVRQQLVHLDFSNS